MAYNPVVDADKVSVAWGNYVEDKLLVLEKEIDAVIGTGGDYPAGSGGLQDAIDDYASTGAHFLMTREAHSLTSPVDLKLTNMDGLVIDGQGWGTVFEVDFNSGSDTGGLFFDGGDALATPCEKPLVLRNFAMSGYGSKNACVYLRKLMKFRLEHLQLRTAGGGLGVWTNAHGLHLKDCITSNVIQCYMEGNEEWGVYMEPSGVANSWGCNAVNFHGGRAQSNTLGGIYNEDGTGNSFDGSLVIEGNSGVGLHLLGTKNNVVDGTYHESNIGADIRVDGNPPAANQSGTLILNSTCETVTRAVILGGDASYCRVMGNYFRYGVELEAGASLNYIDTRNDVIDNSGNTLNMVFQSTKDGSYKGLSPFRFNPYDATAGTTTQSSPFLEFVAKYWTGAASVGYSAHIRHVMASAAANDDYFDFMNDASLLRLYNDAHATKPGWVEIQNKPFTGSTYIAGLERSADPPEPAEGEHVIWMSDGTGKGDDGDILIASKAGGVTKFATLFDHSAGGAW